MGNWGLLPRPGRAVVVLGAWLASLALGCESTGDARDAALLDAVPDTPVSVLEDSLRIREDDAGFLGRLGAAYAARRRYRDAVRVLHTALEHDPTSVRTRFHLARAYCELARFDEAIQAIQEALDRVSDDSPRAAELHHLLGYVYSRQSAAQGGVTNFRRDVMLQAQSAYERAVELTPERALYHLNLATVHDNLQRPESALQHYQRAAELFEVRDRAQLTRGEVDALVKAHAGAGQTLSRQGELQAAVVHLSRAVEMQPDEPEHRYHVGRALAGLGEHAEAEAAYRRALRLYPRHAAARYALAELYFRTGRRSEGEAQMRIFRQYGEDADVLARLRAAVRLDPADARLHLSLGSAFGRLHRYQEAAEQFRLAAQLDPELGAAYFELGNLHLRDGDYAAAIEAFERAGQRMADNPDLMGNLGAAYARSGRYADAIRVLKEAVRSAPDDPRLHYNLGVALLAQQDATGAETELLRAVALDSTYRKAYAALVELYRAQGRSEPAGEAAARLAQLGRGDSAVAPASDAASPSAGEQR